MSACESNDKGMCAFVDINSIKPQKQQIHKLMRSKHKQIHLVVGKENIVTKSERNYDSKTTTYYKTLRQCHLDPILNDIVPSEIAFKYKYTWDAYTGEIIGIDKDGELWFHPAYLIYYFYTHRLDGLWKNSDREHHALGNAEYEGYYDMLVGSGENMRVIGRGEYPELYLFRIPICDCYLEKDYDKSIITMGAKLSNADIDELENLCHIQSVQDEYMKSFHTKCPSIKTMKTLYDSAISTNCIVPQNISQKYPTPQYYYVDKLRNM